MTLADELEAFAAEANGERDMQEQALEDNTDGAEAFIVNRVRTRILPRVEELADRDLPDVHALQERA